MNHPESDQRELLPFGLPQPPDVTINVYDDVGRQIFTQCFVCIPVQEDEASGVEVTQ